MVLALARHIADHACFSVIVRFELEQIVVALGAVVRAAAMQDQTRSEEHTSELQSLMRISYAGFCLKKKTNNHNLNKIQPNSECTENSERVNITEKTHQKDTLQTTYESNREHL